MTNAETINRRFRGVILAVTACFLVVGLVATLMVAAMTKLADERGERIQALERGNAEQDADLARISNALDDARQQLMDAGQVPDVPSPEALVGRTGESGRDGRDGRDGVDGITPPCATTELQCQGRDGRDGIDGTNGTDGKDGADGTDGKDGATGAQGPQGTPGEPGPICEEPLVRVARQFDGETWYVCVDPATTSTTTTTTTTTTLGG